MLIICMPMFFVMQCIIVSMHMVMQWQQSSIHRCMAGVRSMLIPISVFIPILP